MKVTDANPTPAQQGETPEVRPVKCHLCNSQMYYVNDARHAPEVRVEVYEGNDRTYYMFYAHAECWNRRAAVAGPPEALMRAANLCRSGIAGERSTKVELLFTDLKDAQAVHRWLAELKTAAATSSPTAAESSSAQTLVYQWIATLQDESRVTDEDAEDLTFRIIAFASATHAANNN